jgi:hypothetical protein
MRVRTTDSDDDTGVSGSEDEDVVEEDLDDTDSMYDVADTGDHGEPENTDDGHSETRKFVCFWIYQGSHTCAICPKEEQISCPPFITPS